MADNLYEVLDEAKKMMRAAWEAVHVLRDAEAGQNEREEAATKLRTALLPFGLMLPDDWVVCGGCGDAIPIEAVAGHDEWAGALCAVCYDAENEEVGHGR